MTTAYRRTTSHGKISVSFWLHSAVHAGCEAVKAGLWERRSHGKKIGNTVPTRSHCETDMAHNLHDPTLYVKLFQ